MLSTLAIYNYRSLRDLVIPLQRLNLVTGPNRSGKSNLYRALRLLADVAQGRIIPSLAREGGIASTLWAGPEEFSRAVLRGDYPVQGTVRKGRVSLRLGFAGDEFGYAIDLGLPVPSTSAFAGDPEIKRECIWNGELLQHLGFRLRWPIRVGGPTAWLAAPTSGRRAFGWDIALLALGCRASDPVAARAAGAERTRNQPSH